MGATLNQPQQQRQQFGGSSASNPGGLSINRGGSGGMNWLGGTPGFYDNQNWGGPAFGMNGQPMQNFRQMQQQMAPWMYGGYGAGTGKPGMPPAYGNGFFQNNPPSHMPPGGFTGPGYHGPGQGVMGGQNTGPWSANWMGQGGWGQSPWQQNNRFRPWDWFGSNGFGWGGSSPGIGSEIGPGQTLPHSLGPVSGMWQPYDGARPDRDPTPTRFPLTGGGSWTNPITGVTTPNGNDWNTTGGPGVVAGSF